MRKFLGHSDVLTTWGYIVDIDAEEEDRMRVVDALKDLSGPAGVSAAPAENAVMADIVPSRSNIIAFRPSKEQQHQQGTSGFGGEAL